MISNTNHRMGIVIALALAPTLARSAHGLTDSFWIQQFGGFFEVPENWNGPVPDVTVNAIFDLDATYNVLFWHGDGASSRVIVRDGHVTFTLTDIPGAEARFYDAVNPSFVLPSVLVGDTDATDPILTIRGGVLNSQFTVIGLVSGSLGTINFIKTTQLEPSLINQEHVHVGVQGAGILNIANAAQVSCTDAVLGSLDGSSGEVTVLGAGAVLDCNGKLTVGKGGQGTLEASLDGEVHCTSAIIGQQPGAAGEVSIAGLGSLLDIAGTLDVGLHGLGSISVVDGAAMLSEGFATIGTFGEQVPGETGGIGDVTVAGPASAWIHNGDLYVGFQGSGTLDILDGAAVTATRGFVSDDEDAQGVANVDGPGSVWGLSENLTIRTLLTVSDGALIIADGVHVTGGELDGDGTVLGALVNGGTIAPGHPLGALTVMGNYSGLGAMTIELAGTGPGQYDSLEVSQNASVSDALTVSLANGFTPSAGDSFTILSAGTLTGAFASVSLPALVPPLTWYVQQSSTDIVLLAINSADLDGDGSVGILDFLALLVAWGPCPPKGDCNADLDGDGAVGIEDFLALLAAWG